MASLSEQDLQKQHRFKAARRLGKKLADNDLNLMVSLISKSVSTVSFIHQTDTLGQTIDTIHNKYSIYGQTFTYSIDILTPCLQDD